MYETYDDQVHLKGLKALDFWRYSLKSHLITISPYSLTGKRDKSSVQWNVNVDHSHSEGGLKLVNNEIVIPRNGLYFVYSQASFSVNCSSDDDYEDDSRSMVHLSQTVKRWSESVGEYETILHSARTACQRTVNADESKDGKWYTAVYMGAVFSLNRGDKLKTSMEKRMLQELQDEAGKTFFGVFALWGQLTVAGG